MRVPFTRLVQAIALVSGAVFLVDRCGGSSDTTQVGPAGGAVQIDGATLTVPSGALVDTQSLRIVQVADLAGYSLRSATYEFDPTTLTFAVPSDVAIRLNQPAVQPTIYWQQASAQPMPLLTTVANGWAHASVTQLGTGFVVDGFVPPTDGGTDASDAMDDVACVIPPTSVQVGFSGVPTQADNIGKGLLTCPNNTYDFTFSVNQPVLVAAMEPHNNTPPTIKFGFLGDCGSSPTVLTSATPGNVAVSVLNPGTYGYLYCDDLARPGFYASMSVENIPPTATDTSCTSPQTLPYTEPRVIDGQPRVYSFTVPQSTLPWNLQVTSPDTAGSQFNVSIQTVCGNPASQIAALQPMLSEGGGPISYTIGILSAGAYYAIVTNVGYGNQYGLAVTL